MELANFPRLLQPPLFRKIERGFQAGAQARTKVARVQLLAGFAVSIRADIQLGNQFMARGNSVNGHGKSLGGFSRRKKGAKGVHKLGQADRGDIAKAHGETVFG